jgi:hypothetical protein
MQILGEVKFLIRRHLINAKGWRTNEKILVIESDDWGSIRMPSSQVFQTLLKAGYPIDKDPYERFDSLENNQDVAFLFELLNSFRDKQGNSPVFTANCVVGNPDFEKIAHDNFERYHFELCTDTFKKYPEHDKVWDYWKSGIMDGIFFPQFHAREHINVPIIMEALQKGNPALMFGFKLGYLGGLRKEGISPHNIYVKSSYYRNEREKQAVLASYVEGLQIFRGLFGFSSQSFVPTNYMWSPDFDEAMFKEGVLFNQGRHFMSEPVGPNQKRFYRRVLGRKNHIGQIELVRNARFEPSLISNKQRELDNCLREIEIAFQWKRPAIVSMHRINFTGNVDEKNRDQNLKILHHFFSMVLKKWPDIQFMHSVALGEKIKNNI